AQTITLTCADCPRFDWPCGVLNSTDPALPIEPGSVISIAGSKFSPSGNTIIIGRLQPGQITNSRILPRENIRFESPTQIYVKLPEDLTPSYQALINVVNQRGLESSEYVFGISSPCQDCPPRLRPCKAIVNEAGGAFLAGTVTTLAGRFPATRNKVVVEQFDQQNRVYQNILTQGAAGWSESD